MSTSLPSNQSQLQLPNVYSIKNSEQAFSDAFLKAAQILVQHLKQILADIGSIADFTKEPFSLDMLGLFSKMSCHYYSYVLLEIHHDRLGSQFLIEYLRETAITLAYLLEEGDKYLYSEYVAVSVRQARYLLVAVEEQLSKHPDSPDLLSLKVQMETVISNQQEHVAQSPLTADDATGRWGPQETNTTAKRGAVVKLDFLANPARQIALRVIPASWLELQLFGFSSRANGSWPQARPSINFTDLRDTAHLCLHVAQILLVEAVNYQDINLPDIEGQQKSLNVLYEWFHNAHKYQQQCTAATQETGSSDIGKHGLVI